MRKLKAILCRLRLTILIEKEVIVQKSALVSKQKVMPSRIQSTIIQKGLRKSSNVSSCEQTTMNDLLSTIDGTDRKGCKTAETSSLEQVRTSYIVNNTEGRISSEGLNNLYDGIRNLQSNVSDLDSSCDEVKYKKAGAVGS